MRRWLLLAWEARLTEARRLWAQSPLAWSAALALLGLGGPEALRRFQTWAQAFPFGPWALAGLSALGWGWAAGVWVTRPSLGRGLSLGLPWSRVQRRLWTLGRALEPFSVAGFAWASLFVGMDLSDGVWWTGLALFIGAFVIRTWLGRESDLFVRRAGGAQGRLGRLGRQVWAWAVLLVPIAVWCLPQIQSFEAEALNWWPWVGALACALMGAGAIQGLFPPRPGPLERALPVTWGRWMRRCWAGLVPFAAPPLGAAFLCFLPGRFLEGGLVLLGLSGLFWGTWCASGAFRAEALGAIPLGIWYLFSLGSALWEPLAGGGVLVIGLLFFGLRARRIWYEPPL